MDKEKIAYKIRMFMRRITGKHRFAGLEKDNELKYRKENIPSDCKVDMFSSRVCEKGTKSCTIHHEE